MSNKYKQHEETAKLWKATGIANDHLNTGVFPKNKGIVSHIQHTHNVFDFIRVFDDDDSHIITNINAVDQQNLLEGPERVPCSRSINTYRSTNRSNEISTSNAQSYSITKRSRTCRRQY